MAYSIREHKHSFAAWAASRAATRGSRGLDGERGRRILDQLNFFELIDRPELLPFASAMDAAHRDWRVRAVAYADSVGLQLTHGIAAKLINVYMKAVFVCGGHESHANVCALHPPIDRLMLERLWHQNIGGLGRRWREHAQAAWSTYNSDEYQAVIDDVRLVQNESPLWMVEEHWRGYQ